MKHQVRVNGQDVELDLDPGDRLLDVLRGRLELRGSKRACGRGECGACTVLEGGRPVMSCVSLAVRGENIETIESVAQTPTGLALREAFADAGAFQCGFCTPGQIVRGVALLDEGLPATDEELRRQISGNICRCTGYSAIVKAIRAAAATLERSS